MNRPRKTDRHLPACVYFKHGRYWYVKQKKWHDLGTDQATALAEYGRRISAPKGGMAALIEKVYQHHTPNLADNTKAQYRIAADSLKVIFAEFAPEQVKGKHVAAFKMAGEKHPNMTNRKLSFLRVVFNYAVEWQLVEGNPCNGIKRLKENQRDRYLTDEEVAAIRDKAGPRLKVIIDLLFLTGQRIEDVLNIRRADITDKGINFRQEKTDAKLCVAWNPDLKEAVARAKALNPKVAALTLLYSRTGNAPNYRVVLDQWHAARIAAGVVDAIPHDMRAKAATDADEAGQNAQSLLGHTSSANTRRYLRGRQTPVVTGPSIRQASDVGQKSE